MFNSFFHTHTFFMVCWSCVLLQIIIACVDADAGTRRNKQIDKLNRNYYELKKIIVHSHREQTMKIACSIILQLFSSILLSDCVCTFFYWFYRNQHNDQMMIIIIGSIDLEWMLNIWMIFRLSARDMSVFSFTSCSFDSVSYYVRIRIKLNCVILTHSIATICRILNCSLTTLGKTTEHHDNQATHCERMPIVRSQQWIIFAISWTFV